MSEGRVGVEVSLWGSSHYVACVGDYHWCTLLKKESKGPIVIYLLQVLFHNKNIKNFQ